MSGRKIDFADRLETAAKAKQALLEAPDLAERAELIVQLMQFFGRHDSDEGTLQ